MIVDAACSRIILIHKHLADACVQQLEADGVLSCGCKPLPLLLLPLLLLPLL
jgi:hypothetical protein